MNQGVGLAMTRMLVRWVIVDRSMVFVVPNGHISRRKIGVATVIMGEEFPVRCMGIIGMTHSVSQSQIGQQGDRRNFGEAELHETLSATRFFFPIVSFLGQPVNAVWKKHKSVRYELSKLCQQACIVTSLFGGVPTCGLLGQGIVCQTIFQ